MNAEKEDALLAQAGMIGGHQSRILWDMFVAGWGNEPTSEGAAMRHELFLLAYKEGSFGRIADQLQAEQKEEP